MQSTECNTYKRNDLKRYYWQWKLQSWTKLGARRDGCSYCNEWRRWLLSIIVVSCPAKNRQSHNNSIINLHALTCQLNAPVPHSSGVAGDSCVGYHLTAPTLKVFRRRHHKVFIVRIVGKVYTYSDHTHTCGPPAKLSMTRAQHISRKM